MTGVVAGVITGPLQFLVVVLISYYAYWAWMTHMFNGGLSGPEGHMHNNMMCLIQVMFSI